MKFLLQRRVWWIVALTILLLALAIAFVPVRPFGKFTCNDVASTEEAYWEFADGRFYLTTVDSRTGRPNRHEGGTVHKDSRGWFVADISGRSTSRVETTLLTFRMDTAPPDRVFWRHISSP